MKTTHELTRLALVGTVGVAMLLAGCAAQNDSWQRGRAPGPVYEDAAQIRAMPPCRARVVQRVPCSVYLTTADGRGFYLGSPGSKADVRGFLEILKDGQSYDLPGAFLTYKKKLQRTEP